LSFVKTFPPTKRGFWLSHELKKQKMQNKNQPIKVLHVDKDKAFLEVTMGILKMLGDFEISVAQSVSEANKALENKQYDVIVSAYYLNGVNGLEFFSQLKAKGFNIPFVLFTINDDTAEEAKKAGITFIGKYGDPEKVFNQLCEAIKSSRH
jgi:DNA-binding NtrC family response regulator